MKNTIYNVICEGTSEENYIKEINKFFRENSINVSLYPINVGNGSFSQVYKKFKKVKSTNKNQEVVIWVDGDIYKRNKNEKNNTTKEKSLFLILSSTNTILKT